MSYLILVADRNRWQFPVNIAALPLAVLVLFLCALSVRKEWIMLMILSIIGLVAGEVYFIYEVGSLQPVGAACLLKTPSLSLQLTRIYAPSTSYLYRTDRLTLTFFSVFAIVRELRMRFCQGCPRTDLSYALHLGSSSSSSH